MNQNPEQLARDKIDAQLLACGWVLQNKKAINLHAGTGRPSFISYIQTKSVPFMNINTNFDSVFQKLPHLNWLPWIGTSYNPNTLPLILGESHYDDGDGWLIYKNASRSLVTNQGLNSDKKEFSTSRFFRQIEKTTLSKASTLFKDRQDFWNKVAFYNLVQRLLPSRKARPDDADFDLGWENFFHIVEVLKPKIIIRFGKAGFGRLGYYLNNTDTGWNRTVSEFYVKDEPVINLHKNGHHLKMVITNHPTGSFGYSYQKWA